MPLRINLLAEVQAAEDMRRRDPVKRAILAGVLLVLGVGLWCAQKQTQLMVAKAELARMSATWGNEEKNFQQVNEMLRNVGDLEKRLHALVRASTNRFLMGSMLHELQFVAPADIHFTRLRTEQGYLVTPAEPPKKEGTKMVAGKRASSRESMRVVIDAKDYAPLETQNYNAFKMALSTNDLFAARLKDVGGFKLSTLSQPVPDATKGGRTFVSFSLEASFPETVRDE
jgi:hypothetical protein